MSSAKLLKSILTFSLVIILVADLRPALADDSDLDFDDDLLEQLIAPIPEEEQIENYKDNILQLPKEPKEKETVTPKIEKSADKKSNGRTFKEVQEEVIQVNNSFAGIRADQVIVTDNIIPFPNGYKNSEEFTQFDAPVPPAPEPIYQVTVVNTPAVLRSGPSRESGRIYALRNGESVPVIMHRGNWYMVEVNHIRAWLPADVVEIQRF